MATTEHLVRWNGLTQEEWNWLNQHKPDEINKDTLYFIRETGQIYRGTINYTNAVIFVNRLPEITDTDKIVEGKLYVKITDLSAYVWNGNDFYMIIRPVVNSMLDNEDGTEANPEYFANVRAIKEYVLDAIDKAIVNGQITADTIRIKEDITVEGATIGLYHDGDIIHEGTRLEYILGRLVKHRIPPEYIPPTCSMNETHKDMEVGTFVRPTIRTEFKQNDAGPVNMFKLIRIVNGIDTVVVDNNSIAAYTEPGQIDLHDGDNILKYMAVIRYDAGEIKEDNLGGKVAGENILPGDIKKYCSWSGKRMTFFGSDYGNDTIISSLDIRALPEKILGVVDGQSYDVHIKAGHTRVTIAYPANRAPIKFIRDNGTGLNVLDNFKLTTLSVAGNNGHIPIPYNIYTFLALAPFPKDVVYTVILEEEDTEPELTPLTINTKAADNSDIGNIGMAIQFDPMYNQPLDKREQIFDNMSEVQVYTQSGKAYAGQIIKVRNGSSSVNLYVLADDLEPRKFATSSSEGGDTPGGDISFDELVAASSWKIYD